MDYAEINFFSFFSLARMSQKALSNYPMVLCISTSCKTSKRDCLISCPWIDDCVPDSNSIRYSFPTFSRSKVFCWTRWICLQSIMDFNTTSYSNRCNLSPSTEPICACQLPAILRADTVLCLVVEPRIVSLTSFPIPTFVLWPRSPGLTL